MSQLTDLEALKESVDLELFDFIEQWVSLLKNQKMCSDNTIKSYIKDLKFFISFLCGHLSDEKISIDSLRSLRTHDFRAWLTSRIESSVKHRSNARGLSSIRSFTSYLNQCNEFPTKYIDSLRQPKLPSLLPRPIKADVIFDTILTSPLNPKDTEWIILRDRALFMLLYGAGLRIQEALDLRLCDIGELLNVIGKGKKQRLTPLLENVRNTIEVYLKACPHIDMQNDNSYIFWGIKGKRLLSTTVEHRLKKFCREHNLPEYFTPHALRHSFASHLIQRGADMRYVQELLGHSSLSSTQIYTEVNDEAMLNTFKMSHPLEKIKKNVKKMHEI